MAVTLLYWNYLLPDWETMKTLSWGWALCLYAVNGVGIFLMYGSIEFFYYWKRKQGTRFKYNAKFPSEQPSDVFWFKSQNIDNFLRSYLSGIVFWTLVQVFMLWSFANGYVPWLTWARASLYLAGAGVVRHADDPRGALLLHPPPHPRARSLQVDSLGPPQFGQPVAVVVAVDASGRDIPLSWRGALASGDPVQSFRRAVPAQSWLATAQSTVTSASTSSRLTEDTALDSHAYLHYLHHKYFEVNYGGDGLIPLDKWFGTGTTARRRRKPAWTRATPRRWRA